MPVSRHKRQLYCPGCGRRCYAGLKRLIRHYYNQGMNLLSRIFRKYFATGSLSVLGQRDANPEIEAAAEAKRARRLQRNILQAQRSETGKILALARLRDAEQWRQYRDQRNPCSA